MRPVCIMGLPSKTAVYCNTPFRHGTHRTQVLFPKCEMHELMQISLFNNPSRQSKPTLKLEGTIFDFDWTFKSSSGTDEDGPKQAVSVDGFERCLRCDFQTSVTRSPFAGSTEEVLVSRSVLAHVLKIFKPLSSHSSVSVLLVLYKLGLLLFLLRRKGYNRRIAEQLGLSSIIGKAAYIATSSQCSF